MLCIESQVAAFSVLELLFLFWARFDCVDHERKKVLISVTKTQRKRDRERESFRTQRIDTKTHEATSESEDRKRVETGKRARARARNYSSETYIVSQCIYGMSTGNLVICSVSGFGCCSTTRHVYIACLFTGAHSHTVCAV